MSSLMVLKHPEQISGTIMGFRSMSSLMVLKRKSEEETEKPNRFRSMSSLLVSNQHHIRNHITTRL